jgi:hypothetical protein
MRARVILFAVWLCLVPASRAQRGGPTAVVSLKATTKVILPLSEPTVPIGGIMCDREGNIYARLHHVPCVRDRGAILSHPRTAAIESQPDSKGRSRMLAILHTT